MFFKALDDTNLDMQVLIAAHGNSLRALVKILDNVPEDYQKPKNVEISGWLKLMVEWCEGITGMYQCSENIIGIFGMLT